MFKFSKPKRSPNLMITFGGIDIDHWTAENFLRQMRVTRSQIGEIGWLSILELAEQIKIKL